MAPPSITAFTMRFPLLLCMLCAAACAMQRKPAPQQAPLSMDKEHAVMTTSAAIAEPTGLTAQNLSERVIALIKGLAGIDELALGALQRGGVEAEPRVVEGVGGARGGGEGAARPGSPEVVS